MRVRARIARPFRPSGYGVRDWTVTERLDRRLIPQQHGRFPSRPPAALPLRNTDARDSRRKAIPVVTMRERDDTAGGDPSGCPPWCDPAQHLVDDNDRSLIVVHRSRPIIVASAGLARIEQTVRRFGARVVRSPVLITLDFTGGIELQSRNEAADYLKDLTRALVGLTNSAWPTRASALAS